MKSEKVELHGFNNLTKSLCFNMYDICYTQSVEDRKAYIEYIDEQYNAEKLTEILRNVTDIIGAKILNIAVQDYEPQGSSVTILICEESAPPQSEVHQLDVDNPSVVAHLDKSHITVHTYPEYHPHGGVCTFRADIDVSTCGEISPLMALNYLIDSFEADMMTLDYRVRGFTRDITGRKIFIDHDLNSIQNYISQELLDKYYMIDVNVFQENIFHTKCKLKNFNLDNYFFNFSVDDISKDEINTITEKVRKEMDEVFYGRNLP
ncbi:adenosylmethionine decarboxylase [Anaerovorax odorimutans]|uniref:adenosylmethionine decarboxylase n=1 Tax=Anaerovorax odorimutans TaxID=109327 RepID=UPI0004020937|nr:adenosylmethionine decarboxylase [Anaerovorax odorimutans]